MIGRSQTLAQRIRARRDALALTQAQAAARLSREEAPVTAKLVGTWEAGFVPRERYLVAIAGFLGCGLTEAAMWRADALRTRGAIALRVGRMKPQGLVGVRL